MATAAKRLQARYSNDPSLIDYQATFIVLIGPREGREETAKQWASDNGVTLPVCLLSEGEKSPAYKLYNLSPDHAYTTMVAEGNIIRYTLPLAAPDGLDTAAVGKLIQAADGVVSSLKGR